MANLSTPYPKHDAIVRSLRTRNPIQRLNNAVLVATDVLLPNHSHCVVVIEGGAVGDRITVSDAGAALICVSEGGLGVGDISYEAGRRAAHIHGIALENGILRSAAVPIEDAAWVVVLMANAMRDVAKAVFDSARRGEGVRFRERVQGELSRIFEGAGVRRDARIRGSSEDSLRFDYMVTLSSARSMVVDAPLPDASSIASVVLKQTDLRAARLDGIRQAIVYDEDGHWPSSSLAQLKLANVPLVGSRQLRTGLLAAAGSVDNFI